MFLLIELCLCLVAVAWALLSPNAGSGYFEKCERPLKRLAEKRGLAVAVVVITALGLRLALLPVEPIPQPGITDEFSYLLLADTFAHGRVTNPTHPMWRHFESFAVIQNPTYCSAFHPAQGVFLALGQVIGGHPFWGVWFSVGVMCGAICWMLQGWLSPEWALLGGLLAVIRLGSFSYWVNSYGGGAVAAIGGALVLGALPRIKQAHRTRDAVLMGLGMIILANSRPYESIFLCVPIGAELLLWLPARNAPPLKRTFVRVLLPLVVVLLVGAGMMCYYFWRTTGSPFDTAYMVNARTYFKAPNFPWLALRPHLKYTHEVMEKFYSGWPVEAYTLARAHPILHATTMAVSFCYFFFGAVLALPILMLLITLPPSFSCKDISSEARFLLIVCAFSSVGSLLPIYFNPHYSAPVSCVIYALVAMAMRCVRSWSRSGKATGIAIARFIPVICVLLMLLRAAAGPLHLTESNPILASWQQSGRQDLDRALLVGKLERYSPEPQLVLVRYSSRHYLNVEWTYNSADIDHSRLVWARDMGPTQNEELLHYFKNRRVWMVEPDETPPRVMPYELHIQSGENSVDVQRGPTSKESSTILGTRQHL
jgi:hypothetical protein